MKEFFDTLNKHGITSNQFEAIFCLHSNIPHETKSLDVRALISGGFIEEDGKLTHKSIEVINGVNQWYSKIQPQKIELLQSEYDIFIEDYKNIFPSGKLPSGKQARVNNRDLKICFDWFFKNFPDFDHDLILKATRLYVNDFKRKNYLYMATSQYFIVKTEPDKSKKSELANWCTNIQNGDFDEPGSYFKIKVV